MVIGNVMRRTLEAFSTFEYKQGIDIMSCDETILNSLGNKIYHDYFQNIKYRLLLNEDSHMEERIKSLTDPTFASNVSSEEKERTAKDIMCVMALLNRSHIQAHLKDISDADSEITIEKMKTGLSKIRNKGIAAAFSYMNVVEAWGSGIPKMFREAKEYGLREPELIDKGSDFRINLYRKAADVDANGVINPRNSSNNATNSATDSLTEDEKKVIEAIQTKADATQKEMQTMTGITLGTIKRILPRLQAKGIIERIGNRRFGKWKINDFQSE